MDRYLLSEPRGPWATVRGPGRLAGAALAAFMGTRCVREVLMVRARACVCGAFRVPRAERESVWREGRDEEERALSLCVHCRWWWFTIPYTPLLP